METPIWFTDIGQKREPSKERRILEVHGGVGVTTSTKPKGP